jgi:hypothetical protein
MSALIDQANATRAADYVDENAPAATDDDTPGKGMDSE